eukprot:2330605-Prymnesium_polylepis.1
MPVERLSPSESPLAESRRSAHSRYSVLGGAMTTARSLIMSTAPRFCADETPSASECATSPSAG